VFGRSHVKSGQDLARAEFIESMEHFRQAAAHAAGGLGATVGPRVGSARGMARDRAENARGYARGYMSSVGPTANRVSNAGRQSWDQAMSTFGPLAEAARDGSMRAMKLEAKHGKSRPSGDASSHGTMYALLATGAAVGAAGALIARRRTRAKWSEYEPGSLRDDASEFMDAGATSKRFGRGDGGVSKASAWTKEHAKSAVGNVRGKIHDKTHHDDDSVGGMGMDDTDPDATAHAASDAAAQARSGDPISDEAADMIRAAKNGKR